MIQCPNCGNTLPDWAQQCQFCQADVRTIPRAKPDPDANRRPLAAGPEPWVWVLYYTLAGYWVLDGASSIIQTLLRAKGNIGPFDFAVMVFAGVTALTGLGLIFRIELVRGIVNILCWLNILFAVLNLPAGVLTMSLFGYWGVIYFVMTIFQIGVSLGIIWVIGETGLGY